MTKSELVFWMIKELSHLRHFGKWAVGACYDLAGRYGYSYPDCPKSEVVDEVCCKLKELGF